MMTPDENILLARLDGLEYDGVSPEWFKSSLGQLVHRDYSDLNRLMPLAWKEGILIHKWIVSDGRLTAKIYAVNDGPNKHQTKLFLKGQEQQAITACLVAIAREKFSNEPVARERFSEAD